MTTRNVAISLLKVLLKLFGLIVFLISLLFAFNYYEAYPVKSFCSKVPTKATPTDVLTLAKNLKLLAYDVTKERGVVGVINHEGNLFRYACEVHFQNGNQISKGVIVAD